MCDHSLCCRRKHFCWYCLHACKQRIILPKKSEHAKFKNLERKIKSTLIVYVDFESILVPEYNGKQNPNKSNTNKYKKLAVMLVALMINLVSLLNYT